MCVYVYKGEDGLLVGLGALRVSRRSQRGVRVLVNKREWIFGFACVSNVNG